jgi:ubiquinone/menaquinone biosynthesis C-methylase UbiE
VTRPAWYRDEAAHGGPEHLDPDYVAGYDAKAGVDLEEELALLHAHGLGPETILVDLGAGTGALAFAAAPSCRGVVAVDPSPAMLAAARERRDSDGVANVDLVQAGFLTYEHQGEPPQLVYTRNALHHLPDFWKGLALARVHDLLAPGGTLVLRDFVYSFEPRDAELQIGSWLARAVPTAAEGWTRAELEEHVRTEHSTFAWLLEPLLEHAGFAVGEARHRSGVYATYVCVAR